MAAGGAIGCGTNEPPFHTRSDERNRHARCMKSSDEAKHALPILNAHEVIWYLLESTRGLFFFLVVDEFFLFSFCVVRRRVAEPLNSFSS